MIKKIISAIVVMSFALTSFAAEPWKPSKPIEIVVPYPAGGTTDVLGRILAEIFVKHGWEAYVTNKPGANTTIASNYVAKAKPDGTVLYASGVGFLDANLVFDDGSLGIQYTEKDFTDISPMAFAAVTLAVAPGVPVNNYEEFKDYVRKNPEKFNLGYWNSYIANVFYVWAQKEGLPKPNIILYKGSAPMDIDLIGNQLPFAFDAYSALAPFHKDGKLKVIATLDERGQRFVRNVFPDAKIPNLSIKIPEIGIYNWHGVSGPAGMSKEAIREINKVVNEGIKNPEYVKRMKEFNVELVGGKPEDVKKSRQNLYKIFDNAKKQQDK